MRELFHRLDKLRFYGEYNNKEKFPNLKQMTMQNKITWKKMQAVALHPENDFYFRRKKHYVTDLDCLIC